MPKPLLNVAQLLDIMENSHPFSFHSALKYSLHLLCSMISAISESLSHKDGQQRRNAVHWAFRGILSLKVNGIKEVPIPWVSSEKTCNNETEK